MVAREQYLHINSWCQVTATFPNFPRCDPIDQNPSYQLYIWLDFLSNKAWFEAPQFLGAPIIPIMINDERKIVL